MMKTKRDERLTIRIAGPLLAVLEAEAERDSRALTATIRKILIDHAAGRIACEQREAA